MLDYQLDTSTIEWMSEIMRRMLKQLWKTLLSKSKKDWFNIYLIISLLVSNLEMIQKVQVDFIGEHGNEVLRNLIRNQDHFNVLTWRRAPATLPGISVNARDQ